ncbi:MAG: hypothetical protein EOP85_08660, partial [Verrucomicrobiaceae bacterium]
MTGSVQRGFSVLLVTVATGFIVWKYSAGSDLDRTAFTVVARGSVNPPLFVEGEGTHDSPWSLRIFVRESAPDPKLAPPAVFLGDDLAGIFQSSPPGPVDLAVILKNLQRLGVTKLTTSMVLAWDNPDVLEFFAVEKALTSFDSLVTSAPLSRGVEGSLLPQEFRRASLPMSAVTGDASALPVVNRVPLPGVVLGGEKALAGFSVLESEASSRLLPLMARWDDPQGEHRLLFSSALLAVMQRLDLPLSGMEIRPGEFLRLGPDAPVMPIDSSGYLAIPLRSSSVGFEIAAESLIGADENLFPKDVVPPVVLRDDRTTAGVATRAFSRAIVPAVAVMSSEEGLAPSRQYKRLPQDWEVAILAVVMG